MTYPTWASTTTTWTTNTDKWSSQYYDVSASLAATMGESGFGGFSVVGSATFQNTLNQTLDDTLNAVGVSTLSNSLDIAESNILDAVASADLNITNSISESNSAIFGVNATLFQAILSELHEEDRESSLYGVVLNNLGFTASHTLKVPKAATFSTDHTISTSSVHKAVGDATLASTLNITQNNAATFLSSGIFANSLTYSNTEDLIIPLSASLDSNYGIINENVLIMPIDVTYAAISNIINNVNYPVSATISSTYNISSASNFLWNEEAEATDTWTTQSKATDTWTTVTEATDTWTYDDRYKK